MTIETEQPRREVQHRWLALDPKKFLAALADLPAGEISQARHIEDWFWFRDPLKPHAYMRLRREDGARISQTIKIPAKSPESRYTESTHLVRGSAMVDMALTEGPALAKQRYLVKRSLRGGSLFIDLFEGRHAGLIIVECHDPDGPVTEADLPGWMQVCRPINVTHSLTSATLSKLPVLDGDAADPTFANRILGMAGHRRIRMIACTGGPCSGKSTFLRELANDPRFVVVPEIATLIMRDAGVSPQGGIDKLRAFQLGHYQAQRQFEALGQLEAQSREGVLAIVTDRGVPDSAAYLPGGAAEFQELLKLSLEEACASYDGVIQMAVPDRVTYDRHKANNPARRETYDEAKALEDRTMDAWISHPRSLFVGAGSCSWDEKRAAAMAQITAWAAT